MIIAKTEGALAGSALIPDDLGRLHLFYPDQPDKAQSGSINYLEWDGANWSQPIDLILDPESAMPDSIRAVIDEKQIVHLMWHGGNNMLRYASAPLAQVGAARSWSAPQTIATAIGSHDILTATDGVLIAAYATWPETGTIAIIRSIDNGAHWDTPIVAVTTPSGTAPHEIRVAEDDTGRLHMSWTTYELPNAWPAIGAFYAQSSDNGITWSQPQQMASAYHGQIGVTTVGKNEVHLVWRSNIGGDGTFHRHSTDGGTTWLGLDSYDDKGGFSGLPSFGVDSAGHLHYIIGPGYYAQWSEGRLSPYIDVVTPSVRDSAATSNGEQAVLAITSGNVLHVVFETDFTTLWYTTKTLGLPPLPVSTEASAIVIEPEASPPTTVLTVPLETLADEPPEEPPLGSPLSDKPSRISSSSIYFVSIIPAFVLVAVVVIVGLTRRRG